MAGSDHNSGVFLSLIAIVAMSLPGLKPLVVFSLNSNRLMVLVEIPLLLVTILFVVELTIVEPPKVVEGELSQAASRRHRQVWQILWQRRSLGLRRG